MIDINAILGRSQDLVTESPQDSKSTEEIQEKQAPASQDTVVVGEKDTKAADSGMFGNIGGFFSRSVESVKEVLDVNHDGEINLKDLSALEVTTGGMQALADLMNLKMDDAQAVALSSVPADQAQPEQLAGLMMSADQLFGEDGASEMDEAMIQQINNMIDNA